MSEAGDTDREASFAGATPRAEPLGDRRWFAPALLGFVLVPTLPLLLAMAALAFIVEPASKVQTPLIRSLLSIEIGFIDAPIRTLTHLSNLLNYLSVGSVHGIVCLVAIGFFFYAIHRLPAASGRRVCLYLAVSIVALLALSLGLVRWAHDSVLTQLGYKSVCMLLSKADLLTSIVWLDPETGGHTGLACFAPRMTRLVFLAYVPVAFGVAVIGIASALNTVMAAEPMPLGDEPWRAEFLKRVELLRTSLYVSSLVLVTSTVAIFQFASLPLDLLADKVQKAAFTGFVNGIAAFWGGLFTATLFANLAPAAWLLLRQALRHMKGPARPADLGPWLHDAVFVSIKKQFLNALVLIAPMLVGPLGHLLQALPGQ
jgi:hypothetical protein